MTQAGNKVQWCFAKAEKELKEGKKHRGLVKIKPNVVLAKEHLRKADHYLEATIYLKQGNFSDISASTVFYAMYHSLLAIAAKFGYESRNQECSFALIYTLIEEKKISMNQNILQRIASLKVEDAHENESLHIRELYQYGTALSIDNENLFQELFALAQEVIGIGKEIIEE